MRFLTTAVALLAFGVLAVPGHLVQRVLDHVLGHVHNHGHGHEPLNLLKLIKHEELNKHKDLIKHVVHGGNHHEHYGGHEHPVELHHGGHEHPVELHHSGHEHYAPQKTVIYSKVTKQEEHGRNHYEHHSGHEHHVDLHHGGHEHHVDLHHGGHEHHAPHGLKAVSYSEVTKYEDHGHNHHEHHGGHEHHVERHYGSGHHDEHRGHVKYEFKYGVKDPKTGDVKAQWEARHGDSVKGGYSLKESDGTTRVVNYTSDKKMGFEATVHKHGHVIHDHGHH